MRERVEDLGRVSTLMKQVLDLDFWDLYQGRKKDFIENFYALSQEQQSELLHGLIYGMDSVKEALYDIQAISDGQDPLNDTLQD